MIGYKTEYLEVVEQAGRDAKKRAKLWKCLCKCGKFTILDTHSIKAERIKSCGCSRKGKNKGNKFGLRHGLTEQGYYIQPLYNMRLRMIQRCYNAMPKDYPYYQGKGIIICDEWIHNPKSFIEWAKNNGWQKGLSIDRIDPEKGYSPENCQFLTMSENTKRRHILRYIPKIKSEPIKYCYRCKCTATQDGICKKEK